MCHFHWSKFRSWWITQYWIYGNNLLHRVTRCHMTQNNWPGEIARWVKPLAMEGQEVESRFPKEYTKPSKVACASNSRASTVRWEVETKSPQKLPSWLVCLPYTQGRAWDPVWNKAECNYWHPTLTHALQAVDIHTQGNYLKRMAAFTVLRLLYHCEYFIPISNLCVSLRLGTVGSYRQSDRTAWTSAWSCWSHSKPTLWGLFEVRAMVTAKCVVVTIQRGPKSWVEGMDAAISSGWGISQHLHLTGQIEHTSSGMIDTLPTELHL